VSVGVVAFDRRWRDFLSEEILGAVQDVCVIFLLPCGEAIAAGKVALFSWWIVTTEMHHRFGFQKGVLPSQGTAVTLGRAKITRPVGTGGGRYPVRRSIPGTRVLLSTMTPRRSRRREVMGFVRRRTAVQLGFLSFCF